MNGLIILVPVALGLGVLGLAAFFWSVRNGQMDDMDGAAMRILLDDDVSQPDEKRRDGDDSSQNGL